jgi:hypothetical protein
MSRPIVLTGVIHGKTITLDEESFLPDGYRVTLHLVLDPEEAHRLAISSWADLTPEELAELEETLSELRGRPVKLPRADESSAACWRVDSEAGPGDRI